MKSGEASTVALQVVVRGVVQGVWFRRSTQLEADRLGVVGWVRNRADGAVEGFFEGRREAVEDLRSWCEVGPPGARVDAVESARCEPEGFLVFEVRG